LASEPTRILIAGIPRILREMIERAVAAQPDMEVVGWSADDTHLADTLAEVDADVVIFGTADHDLTPPAQNVLDRRARLKMIGIADDDGQVFLWRLLPVRSPVRAVKPSEILAAIRDEGAAA
jgi:DNA-binding NarL/FixJ family response regulator